MTNTNPPAANAPAKTDGKVAILGCGQMGLVCSTMLRGRTDRPGPAVVLWGHDTAETAQLTQTSASDRLPGFELPGGATATDDLAEALADATLLVSAIPTQHVREVWERVRTVGTLPAASAGVVSVSKGIENGTLLTPTAVIADALAEDPDGPPRRYGTLSGPTIAAELARCLPATMIAASDPTSDEGGAFAQQVQDLFSTSWLRVYTNTDLLGVELSGAIKNVVAIAAGILDGLKAGYNAKSALLARGLAEIARLGVAMGAQPDTFFGVAGVGDLATTCFSPEGRNRTCGEALGRGEKLEDYLRRSPSVVEGVATTKSVLGLAERYRVEMPITNAVHAVLFDRLDPLEAISTLMSRELKAERVG
ncbi:MAG: NAD(P)H-dependent glycerol-3-phosphate dehydrogenase [Planctomycetota bacterium]